MFRLFLYEHLSAGAAAAEPELLAAGREMRDDLAADLRAAAVCRATVAGLDAAPEAGEPATEFVAREARRHDAVWVVAPETGGVLGTLQRCVAEGAQAPRWIGCGAQAIALASSKRATLERLVQAGIATPLDFAEGGTAQRHVVKPDDGAGSLATRLHASRAAALADAAGRGGDSRAHVVEPWVEGEPLSLSLLGRDGAIELLSVNRQRLSFGSGGEIAFDGVDLDVMPPSDPRRARLRRLAEAVAGCVPGLRGFVGIDLVWHPARGPVVIEINPRLTSAYVGLAQALGRPLAAEILAACIDGGG